MAWFEKAAVRIHYEESGQGDPVLVVPGWGGSIEELGSLCDALAVNHRVIAVDPPGSGKSGPQPRTYTRTYYQEDSALLLSLLDALDAWPAHLVGFSDGGEYELLMAALSPGVARSLAIWGSAGNLGQNLEMAEVMATVIDQPIPPMAEFSEYLKGAYGEANARVMTRSAGTAFRAIMEAGGDVSRSLAASIACPALLITGEHDFVATPTLVSQMARAIPSGEFQEVPGAGHPVHHERPDWLAQTILDWLEKH